MSVKAIREYDAKKILQQNFKGDLGIKGLFVPPEILDNTEGLTWGMLVDQNPWVNNLKLVAKPDMLVKRRGKLGLVAINLTFEEAKKWVLERMMKEINIEGVKGVLSHFLIEPFMKHEQKDEYYVCVQSHRYFDEIYFYHEGGVDVGDVDAKALRLRIPTRSTPSLEDVEKTLLTHVPANRKKRVLDFIAELYDVYKRCHFVYLEINPLLVTDDATMVLDVAAKLDETAAFLVEPLWHGVSFPAPFGRAAFPEEKFISDLDAKTGASLKLTVLNPHGTVWTMVAGGGASVVFADTVCDYGMSKELANYGEYSGAPTTEETFLYARTLLQLMTRYKRDGIKYLFVGGGIANFTDVPATFTGLIKAIKAFREELLEHRVQIWVRRGGLNHVEGLRLIKSEVTALGIEIHVYGPECACTGIIPMALNLCEVPEETFEDETSGKPSQTPKVEVSKPASVKPDSMIFENHPHLHHNEAQGAATLQCSQTTRCFVYNLQTSAVQRMLDFDAMCLRKTPSVAAVIFPFGGTQNLKVYWGTSEIFLPVYMTIAEAAAKHPDVSMMVNFASFRSVYESTMEALAIPSIKTIAIIAEGVPEQQTRALIQEAEQKKVGIIGPATVGGITPGHFRIGNTGGAIENLTMSKLYRPGSVCYVSKSGGMSNELNNIIARHSDGVCDGVAIGGDRYPGSRFIDHLLKYQANPDCKMIVLLGEVGGVDEYDVIDAVNEKKITKPIVSWCVGTCADYFSFDVQFGHAGAQARGKGETAKAKNDAMRAAGIIVPKTFNELGTEIQKVYSDLVVKGTIIPAKEPTVPVTPKDFAYLKKLGVVRKPANFACSISDDRGEELLYAGKPLGQVLDQGLGIGGVVSLLWFRRQLPDHCLRFIELAVMVCADHGPAVSGAHNTIVAARAGKDLVSSLASGLLTIGPRFGGALDDAAKMFTEAADKGLNAKSFVTEMKKENKLIMGIGHRIKSKTNPDTRVEVIKKYAQENFKECRVLNFALAVEDVTTSKKANLILNVDGCIAVCFVDMLRSSGAFTPAEISEAIEDGCLNGLFVFARTIGLIGHYLDQKRMSQPLYRHPWDDITYIQQQ
jgi:ATP citrate (pro-S)-lyase